MCCAVLRFVTILSCVVLSCLSQITPRRWGPTCPPSRGRRGFCSRFPAWAWAARRTGRAPRTRRWPPSVIWPARYVCMHVCMWDPLGSFSSRRLPFCFLCEGGRRCCSPVPRVDRGGAHPEDLLQGLPRGRRHAVHPHLGGAQEVDCLSHGRSAQIPLRCEPSLTRPCSCPPHPSRLVVKAILAWLLCACRSPWSLFGLEGKAESFGPRCWARW